MVKAGMMLLALSVSVAAQGATVDLRVLETTDLHSNMMDFDYYKDTPTEKIWSGAHCVPDPCRASGSHEQRAGGQWRSDPVVAR